MFEELFDPRFNWSSLVGERGQFVENALTDVYDVLTAYGRQGIQRENGLLIHPDQYLREQQNRDMAVMRLARETGGGFITPDMYPNLFTPVQTTQLPHETRQPDTSYLDWMTQRVMQQELEDRKEWGFSVSFVRIRKTGQIEYGKFADASAQMTNEEWGAGIAIARTWFETNVFGIKMAALAPEFRFSYYDNIADINYALVIGTTWGGTAGITQVNTLVTDINNAIYERQRYVQSWDGKKPFENVSWRLLAPPEFERYMNAALAMGLGTATTEVLQKRLAVTYTPKLPFDPAACKVYLVVDKWKKNELGTRVPFGVFGSTVDIDTFSDKTAYRGAWGSQVDDESGTMLEFDTLDPTFLLAPPLPTRDVT
jgi:hypothetical protein